jgi:hypothetical protein
MKKWLIDDFLSKEASAKFTRIEEENIMNQFNHDLEIMYIKKDYIIPEYFKTDKKNQLLYVYGSGVHSAWLSYRKREMFNATMNITYFEFLDIVREQEYFIKDGVTVNFDFPVNKKRALVFDISKLPDNYNQILESKGFTIDDDGKAKLLF